MIHNFVLNDSLKYVWYSTINTHTYNFCVNFNEIMCIYVRLTRVSTMPDFYGNNKIKELDNYHIGTHLHIMIVCVISGCFLIDFCNLSLPVDRVCHRFNMLQTIREYTQNVCAINLAFPHNRGEYNLFSKIIVHSWQGLINVWLWCQLEVF